MDNNIGLNITGLFIESILGVLIGALVLQHTINYVLKFKPTYRAALKLSFTVYAALILTGLVAGLALFFSTGGQLDDKSLAMLPAISMISTLLVQTGVYKQFLKHPETGQIGFGKAILVSVIQLFILAVIFALTGLLMTAIG